MGLQAQINQFGMLRVVIVFFRFDSGIGKVGYFHVQTDFRSGFLNDLRKFQNRKSLRKLVVTPALPGRSGIQTRELQATDRIADVQEAALLAALAVPRQRMTNYRLDAEAVQHRAENLVVIKTVDQGFIKRDFVRHCAVNHTLVQIGGAQIPDFTREHHVVTVVDFREVIKGAGLLREREHILAAIVLNGDVAFFDIDVRRAVLAHGPKFDQMAIRLKFTKSKKKIQSSDHVVRLGKDGMALVDHRIGSRALFGEMNNGFGLKTFDHRGQEFVVGDVSDVGVDGITRKLLPNLETFTQRGDRSERLRA